MGKVSQVAGEELKDVRERYLSRHENARNWADFGDFAFYWMEVVDLYFVGGFGVMGWVAAQEYYRAEADPLADVAPSIIQHMNQDHADALVLVARAFGVLDAREATMTSVDRLGFGLKLKREDGMDGARIAFSREVRDDQEARAVLIEMIRQAREKA